LPVIRAQPTVSHLCWAFSDPIQETASCWMIVVDVGAVKQLRSHLEGCSNSIAFQIGYSEIEERIVAIRFWEVLSLGGPSQQPYRRWVIGSYASSPVVMDSELNPSVIISQSRGFFEPRDSSAQISVFAVHDRSVNDCACDSGTGRFPEPHESFQAILFVCFCGTQDRAEIGLRRRIAMRCGSPIPFEGLTGWSSYEELPCPSFAPIVVQGSDGAFCLSIPSLGTGKKGSPLVGCLLVRIGRELPFQPG
jgi:hypothetical protein